MIEQQSWRIGKLEKVPREHQGDERRRIYNLIARRAEEIAPFIVMEVLEKAREMERQGIDVVHLEVGEPDFDIPTCVKAAVCAALDDGQTHYTHSQGDIALRETICEHYLNAYGVSITPDQVLSPPEHLLP
jgi:aspartate/methionine/tyrosine aminotransferase